MISIHEAARLRHCRAALICIIKEISIHEAARLRQQKHPKKNLISQNNLYTYYNIPTHNNYILIILNLFTIKSTIFQVRISRDFHVHFLFAPNNSIIKYHHWPTIFSNTHIHIIKKLTFQKPHTINKSISHIFQNDKKLSSPFRKLLKFQFLFSTLSSNPFPLIPFNSSQELSSYFIHASV